jgi:CheY-like chemotaxis protein
VTRILLADDQALVRGGFRLILDAEPDMEVVAEAADGHEAVSRAIDSRPDLVLMDIRMPVLDGIEATRLIKAADATRDARVIACTGSPSRLDGLADTLFVAVLSKPASPADVLATVRQHAAA